LILKPRNEKERPRDEEGKERGVHEEILMTPAGIAGLLSSGDKEGLCKRDN